MNACENYIEKILLAVDGELDAAELEDLQAHLAVCDGCRCLYETYQNIAAGILDMEEEAPEELAGAVMRSIRREQERKTPAYFLRRGKFTLLAAAACLALVVVAKGFDFSPNSSESATAEAREMVEPSLIAETTLTEAYEAETEALPEMAMETAEEETDPEMMVGGDLEDIRAVLTLMEEEGYFGDLVEIYDLTEEELLEQFPECCTVILEDDTVLYQVAWSNFDPVAAEFNLGSIFSTQTIGDYVFLWLK